MINNASRIILTNFIDIFISACIDLFTLEPLALKMDSDTF